MKQLYVIGNWKSNKTVSEARQWLLDFSPLAERDKGKLAGIKIIICAPYTDLAVLNQLIYEKGIPVELGAQAVSPFSEGAYTGQITARMLSELVRWVIIGHSERRKFFHETDEELALQVALAKKAGLSVVYCVPDDQAPIPPDIDIIGYEPVWAIGTGKTDSPANAGATVAGIKNSRGSGLAVYGGSVTEVNVKEFVGQQSIDGVLVGGASLDPEKFHTLIMGAVS